MKRWATLWPLMLLAGCANWTVRSESHPAAPLAAYRTYEWAIPETTPEGDRLVDQRVRERVVAELARRGMVPAAPGQQPDFYVDYSVGSGPRVQQVAHSFALGTDVGGSGATVLPPAPTLTRFVYTEQALVLDFVDARSGQVFWRGYASYVVDRPPEVATNRTSEAVGRILRKYPGPQLAASARPAM
jgi:hypothetical protein